MRPFFVHFFPVKRLWLKHHQGGPQLHRLAADALDLLHFSMVIAMASMGMMEVAIDQVIGVIAMGDGGMPAIGSMNMIGGMAPTFMILGATIRVGGTYGNGMFLDHFPVLVMKVAVVDVVDMPFVLDGGVTTAWTMNVVMVFVLLATFCHGRIPWVNVGLGYSVIGWNCAIKPAFQRACFLASQLFDFPGGFRLSVFPPGQETPKVPCKRFQEKCPLKDSRKRVSAL